MSLRYLDILGTEYSVFFYDKSIPGADDERWGECNKHDHTISVRYSIDPIAHVDTLLHELFHAIYHEYYIAEEGEEEEQVVSKLASGMAKVLTANPELYKWIGDNL